jgi:hypothetical protein
MSNNEDKLSTLRFDNAKILLRSIYYKGDFLLTFNNKREEKPRPLSIPNMIAHNDLIQRRIKPDGVREGATWTIDRDPNTESGRGWSWQHIYLPTSRIYMGSSESPIYMYSGNSRIGRSEVVDIEGSIDRNFADSLQGLWNRRFSDILGNVRTIQQEALQSIFIVVLEPDPSRATKPYALQDSASPFDADRAFERMTSFLDRQSSKRVKQALGSKDGFAKRYEREPRLRRIVNQIDSVEARIEAEMRPIKEISSLIERLFLRGKSLSFEGPRITVRSDENLEIGLERLSSGEKHLIRILLAAIDAEESTLLIDEPELSLHIDWQRDLIKNIRLLNPKCQLILATHSPDIMADSPDENIFRI